VRDPKQLVPQDAGVDLHPVRYVSRGGFKLEHALQQWAIPIQGKIILDAGASTGGFTDCLLQFGACHVYAVDVGRSQIHPKFRTDSRVTVMETTNILEVDSLDPPPAGAVCDLSFRSLRGAARHILNLTTEHWLLALAKPQFEWEEPSPDFDGVVRSEENIQRILSSLIESLEKEGVKTRKVLESPLKGRFGNREFFFYLDSTGTGGA